MAPAKTQQRDEHEKRVQEALRAIREGLDGGVAAAVELYGVPQTTLRKSSFRESVEEGSSH
ncbi:hypothetical protein HOY80DRAFT_1052028 [Tuber brumale]|nr:hypothetical protein HOY80DRAFT_1052028 [Tuber brumale]